jgi:hypothetical protein
MVCPEYPSITLKRRRPPAIRKVVGTTEILEDSFRSGFYSRKTFKQREEEAWDE